MSLRKLDFKDKKENKVLEEIIFQNEIGRIRDIQIQPITGKIFILTSEFGLPSRTIVNVAF